MPITSARQDDIHFMPMVITKFVRRMQLRFTYNIDIISLGIISMLIMAGKR